MKQRNVYRSVERFEEEYSGLPSNVTWVEVMDKSVSISRSTEESGLMKIASEMSIIQGKKPCKSVLKSNS